MKNIIQMFNSSNKEAYFGSISYWSNVEYELQHNGTTLSEDALPSELRRACRELLGLTDGHSRLIEYKGKYYLGVKYFLGNGEWTGKAATKQQFQTLTDLAKTIERDPLVPAEHILLADNLDSETMHNMLVLYPWDIDKRELQQADAITTELLWGIRDEEGWL